MAMTALGSLLAMLAGLVRDLAQLAASPSGLTALAATVLAGAMLVAVVALLTSVAGVSRAAALPLVRPAASGSRWRKNAARQDFSRSARARRTRPRAPSAALAAATSR